MSHWKNLFKVTIALSTDCVCVSVPGGVGGHHGSRKNHTPAEGGTIPKVTLITSPELCPDTPFAFSLSLFLCLCQSLLSAGLFFITIKGQPEPKDGVWAAAHSFFSVLTVGGGDSRGGNESTFWSRYQHYRTCGKHMNIYFKYCVTMWQHCRGTFTFFPTMT